MIADKQSMIGWALNTAPAESTIGRVTSRGVIGRLAMAFAALVILLTAAYAWLRPDHNWDMLAYVAVALENRYSDPVELHAQTWAEIEKEANEGQLYHLRSSNPYNLHQWENPADFQSQLFMYRVKIGYTMVVRALEPLTGLAEATILISILPSVAFGFLALWWLGRENAMQGALVLMPLLVIADYVHMTTAVVPDMLLALVSLAAILLLARGKDLAACALLFASVFVRPDNIILIFALLITAVLFGWRILPMLITFVSAFIACALVSSYSGHLGWWAHFYFSCIQLQNSMIGFAPDFSLTDMVKGYVRGVVVALTDSDWPGLWLLLVCAWALLWKTGRLADGRTNALLFALAIGTLGKFASFPLPDDRFYFTFISAMMVLLVAAWKPRFDRDTARTMEA